jgi:hypothetical protein
MGFNWKSLFIVDEEAERNAANQPINTTSSKAVENKETESNNQKSTPNTSSTTNNEAFNEVLNVYEKGFESLNHEGYDFFELYKSVMAVGADNPQSYQMAFVMGKSIKGDLTKESLLEKSQYYVQEIEKVHAKYADIGNKKKNELTAQLNAEKSNLTGQINDLEAQLLSIQKQLSKNKTELSEIDSKFNAPLANMEQRIEANNKAKETLLTSIQKVINGINQNLK